MSVAKHLIGDLVKIRRFKDLCCEFGTTIEYEDDEEEYGEEMVSIWPFFTQRMEIELSNRVMAIEQIYYNAEGERTVYSIDRWILVDEFLEEGGVSDASGT